jgi:Spy/CpxP family protein refolding chaperone
MNRAILGCVVLFSLLLNMPSLAQEFQSVPFFIRPVTKAMLLRLQTVQRDLDLTDEQIRAIGKIQQPQMKAADREKRLAAYAKNGLTASQLARLEEIHVQTRGAESLYDSTIATKLRLSDDQKTKLVDVGKNYYGEFDAWRKLFQDDRPTDPEGVKAWAKRINLQRQAIMEQFDDRAMSILTPEQLDEFKKLRGKPIDFSGEKNTGGGGVPPRFLP